MTGKGSAPRPLSVSEEEFGKRFDAIDWSDRGPERDYMRLIPGEPPAPGERLVACEIAIEIGVPGLSSVTVIEDACDGR